MGCAFGTPFMTSFFGIPTGNFSLYGTDHVNLGPGSGITRLLVPHILLFVGGYFCDDSAGHMTAP